MRMTFWFRWQDGVSQQVTELWIAGVTSIAEYIHAYEKYHNYRRTIYKVLYRGTTYYV